MSRLFEITLKLPSDGVLSKATASGVTTGKVMNRLRATMGVVMKDLDRKHKSKMFSNISGATRGHGSNKLGIRSSKLRASYKTRIKKDSNTVTGTRGSRSKYAAIHEFGETINAKKKWLWIPVLGNKLSPTEFRNQKHFYLKSDKGKTAMLITGKKESRPAFALRKSVDIPKRDILFQAYNEVTKSAKDKFSRAVVAVMEGR